MSREIKFRAWDGTKMRGISKNDFFSIRSDGMTSQNIPVDLMQFTGMKDSECKDIYEGDILDSAFYAIVKYSKDSYVVSNKENRHVKGSLSEFLRIRIQGCGKCKVIGNIFEGLTPS